MTGTVFALVDKRAAEVISEIAKPARSENALVRGLVDNNVGYVNIATSRPQGLEDERVIRIDTENPERALEILPTLPGVQDVATRLHVITNKFEEPRL